MMRQGSPKHLRSRAGVLARVETTPLPDLTASHLEAFALHGSSGLEVHGLVRVQAAGHPPYAGAVVVGGMKRGSRVVALAGLDDIARSAVLVSPDYPIRLRADSWRALSVLPTLARLRPAALDSVCDVLLLTEYLSRRADVDARRIFLIGGSLGSAVVTVAGAIDTRPAAIVLLYGGGDLGPLIAHTLRHPAQDAPVPRVLAPVVGRALAWWLTPLAPEHYASAIAPRTLIMINGAEDSLVPWRYALTLYGAAREPKELVWVEGEHIQPSESALIERLSGLATGRLVAHGLLR
jgi:fermentation-respiration switch protein FrsA (DUF1100 family)